MLVFTQSKAAWLTAISTHCLASLHYLPRCLRWAVTCGKTPTTVTWSEDFAVFCYAIKTNSRTIRLQVSQPASTGKAADMSELQAHHCVTP